MSPSYTVSTYTVMLPRVYELEASMTTDDLHVQQSVGLSKMVVVVDL